jgi:hypothetical protein
MDTSWAVLERRLGAGVVVFVAQPKVKKPEAAADAVPVAQVVA